MKDDLMITMRGGLLILCGYSFSFIMILISCVNASDDVNSSSMNMTMMKMMERGDIAMGFNQNKIIHQFVATPVGGKIVVMSLNNTDIQTIKEIKNHIIEIQREFSNGNITKPFFIHAQEVPGTKVITEKKYLIKYDILEMNNGSSLLLTTNDKELIDAINQFMKFQAREHYGH